MTTKAELNIPAVSAGETVLLPLAELELSPLNPRKTHSETSIAELADSIAKHGILNPLLIRLVPIEGDVVEYHIIAGSRRFAAAERAGLEVLPCQAREMTDDEARELALVDNLQREDMPALEEADAYEALRQQLGTAEAIAARVGKAVEYVAKRLRLTTLGQHSRQALAERLITIDHALLLARLGLEDEEKALKWTLDRTSGSTVKVEKIIADRIEKRGQRPANMYHGYSEPETVLKLKAHIERESGRALSKAPWDLDDAKLVTAVGACRNCPQNTAANTSLFSDLAIEEATCADGICFESKRDAFVRIKLHDAYEDRGAVKLSFKDSEAAPRTVKETGAVNEFQVLRHGQWVEAKRGSCDHVRNGVTVDWQENRWGTGGQGKPGMIKLVCIAAGCKAHPKAYEKKASQPSAGLTQAQRDEQERKKKEAVHLENQLRMGQAIQAVEKVTALPWPSLRELLLRRARNHDVDVADIKKHLYPGFDVALETAAVETVAFAKAVAVLSIAVNGLGIDEWERPDADRDRFLKELKRLGHDGSKPWASKAAEKPAPKKAVPAKKAAKKKAVRS